MLWAAWVPEGAAYDVGTMRRLDLPVQAMTLTEAEGEAAALTLTVEDPTGGPLALGARFIWVSCDMAGPDGVPVTVPLFYGRLTGVPSSPAGVFVDYEFVGGATAAGIKAALEPYKVLPGWDPLFAAEGADADPAEVLDGYHAILHLSATGGAPRVVDALTGAGPVLDLPAFLGAYDDLTVSLTGQPLAEVTWSVTARWTQTGGRQTDIGALLRARLGGPIHTLSPLKDFYDTWPVVGEAIEGYDVISARLVPQYPDRREVWDWREYVTVFGYSRYYFAEQIYDPVLVVSWTYEQSREEVAQGTLVGAFQPVAVATAPDVHEERLSLRAVDEAIVLADGTVLPAPLAGTAASFFLTDRGRLAIEHAMQVAAVRLAESQRCVRVGRTVPWPEGRPDLVAADCTAPLRIHHPRLPGGSAWGKIVERRLKWSGGDEPVRTITWTIACSVGQGGGADFEQTEDQYAADYTAEGYATRAGWRVARGFAPLVYESFDEQQPTAGVLGLAGLSDADIAEGISITNLADEQWLAAGQAGQAGDPRGFVTDRPTTVAFNLASLTSAEDARHVLTVTMPVPYGRISTLDLESP